MIPAIVIDNQDWCISIIQNLRRPSSTVVPRDLKEDFTVVNAEIYFRGGGGVMARALSTAEAKKRDETRP